MPIRPIDFQNTYLRIEELSKNVSYFINQKNISDQIKGENINNRMNEIKEKVTKIEKIIDYENRISRLLNDNAFSEGKQQKNKNYFNNQNEEKEEDIKKNKNKLKQKFINGKSEEDHIIDRKV